MDLNRAVTNALNLLVLSMEPEDLISIDNDEPTEKARALMHIFSAHALLEDIDPDTLQGDAMINRIYNLLPDRSKVDPDRFDLYMWSELS